MNWLLAIFAAIAVCGVVTLWKRRSLAEDRRLMITGILVPTDDPINDRFEIFIAKHEWSIDNTASTIHQNHDNR